MCIIKGVIQHSLFLLSLGQKIQIDIFPKKTYRWPRCIWKDVQHCWMQINLQWDITSHLSNWPSSKKSNKWRRYGEKTIFLHYKWEWKLVHSLQKTWRFLKTLKLELPYDLAIPLLWYISRKNANTNLKRYMHSNAQQHHLQQPRIRGSHPSVHQQTNG